MATNTHQYLHPTEMSAERSHSEEVASHGETGTTPLYQQILAATLGLAGGGFLVWKLVGSVLDPRPLDYLEIRAETPIEAPTAHSIPTAYIPPAPSLTATALLPSPTASSYAITPRNSAQVQSTAIPLPSATSEAVFTGPTPRPRIIIRNEKGEITRVED